MAQSHLAMWLPGRGEHYYRDKLDYTQDQVARFLALSTQTVRRWEQGKKCPTVGEVLGLAKFLKIPQELSDYMEDIARNESQKNFRATRRFNALCLQFAELYNGQILKWNPVFIPGIAQTRAYHRTYLPLAQRYTEEQLDRGEIFKQERTDGLLGRTDDPTVCLLIGDQALSNLSYVSEEDRREQIDHLLRLAALRNWEIRVVVGPIPEGGGAFEIYRPNGSDYGGPPFAYTEVLGYSWCIEEPERIGRYDDLWKFLWGKSIALKEFLNDRRYGLA